MENRLTFLVQTIAPHAPAIIPIPIEANKFGALFVVLKWEKRF